MPKQKELQKTLARFVRGGRLSHAVLIEGPRGCGKEELALWLVTALFCRQSEPPCGACPVCRKVRAGAHPDVELLRGTGKTGAFTVDQVRGIRDGLWLSTNEAAERVYILADIDCMNPEAQNAFLKSLEEPPPFVRFIMTCRNRSALLDTIVSRSALFSLEPPTPAECAAQLEKSFPAAPREDVALAALAFDGCTGAAAAALSDGEGLALSRLALSSFSLMKSGRAFRLMAALSGEAGSREAMLEYLERLRTLASAAALPRQGGLAALLFAEGVSPAAALDTALLCEKAAAALSSNCSPELVGTWFCGELSKIFGGNL